MRKVTLRSLWEHKRRLVSTVMAVVLGVAFMSSTFIMSTTLSHSFDDLFSQVVRNTDVVVQGKVVFTDLIDGDQHANLPAASTLAAVQRIKGVALAVPRVSTQGVLSPSRLVDRHGKPLGGGIGTTLLESWMGDGGVNPYHLTSGHGPTKDGEMVLNVGAAEEAHVRIGDTLTVVTQATPVTARVVGTFALGAAKSAGGVITAAFTLPEAQRLIGLKDEVQSIYVKAAHGVSQQQLVARLAPALPPAGTAITRAVAIKQLSVKSQNNFRFLKLALTIFGAIALLVGTFVISNTFSILVAQRTKELALLRALGASRAQVLGSVLLEASVVGAIAAVLGIGVGFLVAQGVTAGITASGAQLPNSTLVVSPTTLLLSLGIGLTVTLLASLLPALRATRVPPLAALRDIAIDRSSLSRFRIGAGLAGLVIGAFELSASVRDGGASSALPSVGIGAALVVISFLVIGPVVAGRSIRLLGLPLPNLTGVTGKLATENAARSPKRTSATVSAVVIGVALVVFITAFASSASTSVRTQVNRGVAADFIVTHKQQGLAFGLGMPTSVATTAKTVPGVDVVAGLGFGTVGLRYPDGKTASHFAESVDPIAVATVFRPRMQTGTIASLDDAGIVLDQSIVKQHHMSLGDRVVVTGTGGRTVTLRLQVVSNDPTLIGLIAMTTPTFASINPNLLDVQVGGTIKPGADLPTVLKSLRGALRDVPSINVLDREGFIGSLLKQITSYITLVYGLLVLSVITALVGIANTLSLSINERTRELGLLRAVGMDRAGVRATVRFEALLISALGALVGLLLGMVLSVAVIKGLHGVGLSSFALPTTGLVVVVVATIALGTLASVRPSRRAARLSILDAIATE